jgi:hypothetical protein
MLRLRFNVTLAQFDIFADALTQRSEQGTGVLLAGSMLPRPMLFLFQANTTNSLV